MIEVSLTLAPCCSNVLEERNNNHLCCCCTCSTFLESCVCRRRLHVSGLAVCSDVYHVACETLMAEFSALFSRFHSPPGSLRTVMRAFSQLRDPWLRGEESWRRWKLHCGTASLQGCPLSLFLCCHHDVTSCCHWPWARCWRCTLCSVECIVLFIKLFQCDTGFGNMPLRYCLKFWIGCLQAHKSKHWSSITYFVTWL